MLRITSESPDSVGAVAAVLYDERARVLAAVARALGDLDLAEDAVHEAIAVALERWPIDGIPDHPRAWLISTARFKGIDALRRARRLTRLREVEAIAAPDVDVEAIDETLGLIFACCHPALTKDAALALTLRELCGLTTQEIARACLSTTPTIAQRIVRAKAKLRSVKATFETPSAAEMNDRLEGVLQVVYLVFNEGYYATAGDALVRPTLSMEAIRLARLIAEGSRNPEAYGLLALLCLQESRSVTRFDDNGDIVLLADQDRSRWNVALIREGLVSINSAGRGPYALQARIAAVHAQASSSEETDWPTIVTLYDELLEHWPSPVVALNRGVAVAMACGPEAGLLAIDPLAQSSLTDYGLAHSSRGELLRRLGRRDEAKEAYGRALDLATLAPERRLLEQRIRFLENE